MRNFSYYGLLKIAQVPSPQETLKQQRLAEVKAMAAAARNVPGATTTETTPTGGTRTTTKAIVKSDGSGGYSASPVPSPAQQPATTPAQQPGSQPVKNPAQPAPQPQQQPQKPQQPSYRQQAWNNMDQGQRDAFRNWAQKDGRGKTFGAMFRGADGKIDQAAADKFLQDNPNFLTGTDADRDAILKKRYGQLSQDQANAFKQSKEYQDYRSAATARQQAKQQAQQAQVDANVGAYDKRQAQLQRIYDDPVGATRNWAAGQMRAGVSAQSAADSTVQAWRNARDELEKSKGFASWVDPRTGKVVSSAGGNVDKTLAANRPAQPRPVRNPASYNTGGGLPGSLAGTKAKPAPQPRITTVAQRGGSPSLYRMKGRTRLYNRG